MTFSSVPGGDGVALFLEIQSGGFGDIAQVRNTESFSLTLSELPDLKGPELTTAIVDLNNGLLRVNATEVVDLTPPTNINVTQFFIANVSGDQHVSLKGAVPLAEPPGNAYEFSIKLTEAMRVKTIEASATPGGDGGSVLLEAGPGAALDVAGNPTTPIFNTPVLEIPDTTVPIVESGLIDYDTRIITLTASETLDVTPGSLVDLSKLSVSNVSGEETFALSGSSVLEVDGVTMNITIKEPLRIQLIPLSSTPGGDGSPLVLDVAGGALQDIAGNPVASVQNIVLSELPDRSPPTIIRGEIFLGDGMFTLIASETIDATPESEINTTLIHLSNVSGEEQITFSQLGGASVVAVDGVNINFTLSEQQRVVAIENSATPGGDGGSIRLDVDASAVHDIGFKFNLGDFDLEVTEHEDTIIPAIFDVAVNLTNGIVILNCSETIDSSPTTKVKLPVAEFADLGTLGHASAISLTGARVIEVDTLAASAPGASILELHLSEKQRVDLIAISGTPGGDGGAAFLNIAEGFLVDIGQNENSETVGLLLQEAADIRPPALLSARVHYGLGILYVNASETIDVTPREFVNLSHVFLAENEGDQTIGLADAAVITSTDTDQLEIQLTEEQRVSAILQSGTSGGDLSPLLVNAESLFVRDIGTNFLSKVSRLDLGRSSRCNTPKLYCWEIEPQ